ncbi:lipid transfer-like protein VAS isoform X1 [Cinnamomum micranthum f. kanehirae]|uniref:Lipid transfer-like protein VAS isoform X1 n=1 Tax=Cinnamomum micranthum f. kanehirae TaxID=337451 RepID=A0A3S3Q6F9_9MAGN|nr:lipid transfer-like protein VAS isoform X1 [Cinnamomum micranthum f. kanehirae]
MDSKVLVSAILFASCFYVGFSQQEPSGIAELEFDCMESFMPCQSHLQPSSSPPPSSCCTPMKKMVESNQKCFCAVFDNVPLLKTLNVTQEDALKLPKACEAETDLTVCKSLKEKAAKTISSATAGATGGTSESDSQEGSGGSASSTEAPSTGTSSSSSSSSSSAHGLSSLSKNRVILASMVAWMLIFV